jgi:hypothetical protein
MVEQLVIEESKHEALEEMYFWPAVREKLPDGDQLAGTAIGQEQEGKEVLDKLDKLDADDAGFEKLVTTFGVVVALAGRSGDVGGNDISGVPVQRPAAGGPVLEFQDLADSRQNDAVGGCAR